MTARRDSWDLDAPEGFAAEVLVARLRDDVLAGTCEVKLDRRAIDTGNVYLERSCCNNGGWMASGIAATRAANWAHVLGGCIVLWMPTTLWLAVLEVAGEPCACSNSANPTVGDVVPVDRLLPVALDLLRMRGRPAP